MSLTLISAVNSLRKLKDAVYISKHTFSEYEKMYLGFLNKLKSENQVSQYEVSKNFNSRIVDYYTSQDVECDVKAYFSGKFFRRENFNIRDFSNKEIFDMKIMSFKFKFDFSDVIFERTLPREDYELQRDEFLEIIKIEFFKVLQKINGCEEISRYLIEKTIESIDNCYIHRLSENLSEIFNKLLELPKYQKSILFFFRKIVSISKIKNWNWKNALSVKIPKLDHFLIFHQDCIDITNEVGLTHRINDIFYSFSFRKIFRIAYSDYCFENLDDKELSSVSSSSLSIYDISIFRTKITLLEAIKNYSHSHVNGLHNHDFCLGASDIAHSLISYFKYSMNYRNFFKMLVLDSELTDDFKEFLMLFYHNYTSLIKWESIEGGPYARIDELYDLKSKSGGVSVKVSKKVLFRNFQDYIRKFKTYYFNVIEADGHISHITMGNEKIFIDNFSHVDDEKLSLLIKKYESEKSDNSLDNYEDRAMFNKIVMYAINKAFNPDWSINKENLHYLLLLFSSYSGLNIFSNINYLRNFIIENQNDDNSFSEKLTAYFQNLNDTDKNRIKKLAERSTYIEFQNKKYYSEVLENDDSIFNQKEKALHINSHFVNLVDIFQNNIL